MYNLDINFLKDRSDYAGAGARGPAGRSPSRRSGAAASSGGRSRGGGGASSGSVLAIGALVGLLPLALVGLGWGWLAFQKNANENKLADLKVQVAEIEQKEKERDKAKADLASAKSQIESLTGVFSNIKPWSAMSQDLRDRLPAGVQITEILQKTEVPPAPVAAPTTPTTAQVAASGAQASPSAAPTPVIQEPIGRIEITGAADNFDRVNDFLVVLQKSNFLNADQTKIITSERQSEVPVPVAAVPLPNGQTSGSRNQINPADLPKLPAKVTFKIETELANVSTDELLRELERKGAVGLVSRIDALKQKGVIKP
jgi:type IV pilus assembly protein PilN